MTPAARIQATIDLLERISKAKIPMDATCGDYFRVRRYIGSKDRNAVVERAYAVVRAHARLGWWLERAGHQDTPRARVLAWVSLEEREKPDKLFDGKKYSPAPLTEEEKTLVSQLAGQALEHPDMPPSVRAECPPYYEENLRAYFGDSFETEMAAMISGAPLDLRINIMKADREKVQKFLEADGVKTQPTPVSPWGLRCEGKAFLSRTKAFAKGWIDIQDEGSQLIAHVCGVQPGLQVLDYCAGAGGKTLALAGAMQNKGRIVAMDLEPRRLEKGKQRFKRAGVSDIIETRPLSDEKNRKWLRRQKGTFDVVMCDVPCTGTGTWRRNPDMRWRTYGPDLEELTGIQADILDRVAHTVKPGGKLVYATCSLLPEENEKQIEAFLERHPEFEVMPLKEEWCEGLYMRLTPHRHNTDGFFAAVLIKA